MRIASHRRNEFAYRATFMQITRFAHISYIWNTLTSSVNHLAQRAKAGEIYCLSFWVRCTKS